MKLSRAVALAAGGVDLRAELLRATAQALTLEQRATENPPRRRPAHSSAISVGDVQGDTQRPVQGEASRLARNLRAVQASRSLLMRTIEMLK